MLIHPVALGDHNVTFSLNGFEYQWYEHRFVHEEALFKMFTEIPLRIPSKSDGNNIDYFIDCYQWAFY